MSKEQLTHSERYLRKTNRIILIIGIIALFVFLFALMLLNVEPTEEEEHTSMDTSIDDEANQNMNSGENNEPDVIFDNVEEEERPITLVPNPMNMGQVVIGNEAKNVLTIGTNGKKAIHIVSVETEDAEPDGFKFETDCNGKDLRGKTTCTVTMSWLPSAAINVQNNFKITWRETNVSDKNAKHDEVPFYGSAIHKEDCNFCGSEGGSSVLKGRLSLVDADGKVIGYIDENGIAYDMDGKVIGKMQSDGTVVDENGNVIGKAVQRKGTIRAAVGVDGNIIGSIDEDGIVSDANGNEIGRVEADGLIVDKDGTVIGVAGNRRLLLDENGDVIGYVDENGIAYDKDGNVIGRMLSDGTVVDADGNVIGRAVDMGYVYDKDGVKGKVLPDGTVVDIDGNVIGRLNGKGEVLDKNGNIIGNIAKAGEVAFDENGNILGVVMPNGDIFDENGNVVGFVDGNGNVVKKQTIGKRDATARLAYDKNGKVIGWIDENGSVRDFDGNIIGHIDENGNIVDENGNIIGHAGDGYVDLAVDENGNPIGWIDKNGIVRDKNGNIVGVTDKNGNIVGNKKGIEDMMTGGQKGKAIRLTYDKDGNVIGWVDENGVVRDFDGNIVGHVDENGNVIDESGNIIGNVGKIGNLAEDKDGNVIGYILDDIVYDKSGSTIGIVDKDSNVRVFGLQKIGSLLDKNLIPITPAGTVLGTVNNRGEIVSQKKVLGKMRPNGIVTDKTGSRILAKGIHPGYVVNWGCDFETKIEKDGTVTRSGEPVDYRIYADGTVWTPEGRFAGITVKSGSVYNNECVYVGYAGADGYVRDENNRAVGCVNPDGSVLDLEKPQIKGHLVEPKTVMSTDWTSLGTLDESGTLRISGRDTVGCVNEYGEVYDQRLGYLGKISAARYAFGFDGKPLGYFDEKGNISLSGDEKTKVFLGDLVAGNDNKIIGFAAPEVNILIDARGNIMGHLFPDGNVYDKEGGLIDKISGRGTGLYNGEPAKFLETGAVVDNDGQLLGYVSYDSYIVDSKGSVIGKVDAKGRMFDGNGRQIGGIVKQGGVRGYHGAYLGYVTASGRVVELTDTEDSDGNKYRRGDITGRVVPDGHIVNNQESIIGEVLPERAMIDLFGNYVGFADAYGVVRSANGKGIASVLPGGGTMNNITSLPEGLVVDYSGNIIGTVLPDGNFMNLQRIIGGIVLADGKVASSEGKLLGEVVSGDIVIGNDDTVKGLIGFDGKVYQNGNVVGRLLTDGLAVDMHNNVLGHAYTIGSTVLSNSGEYKGRLSANGKVVENKNMEIGYMKSNGSFVDADKNVSGYLLPEVAKNRRN